MWSEAAPPFSALRQLLKWVSLSLSDFLLAGVPAFCSNQGSRCLLLEDMWANRIFHSLPSTALTKQPRIPSVAFAENIYICVG